MKHYFLFVTAMFFLFALCSCKKENATENNDTTLTKITQKETGTLDFNDVHTICGTLIGIDDLYSPEDIDNINYASPIGSCLYIKLNQQDTERDTYVVIELLINNRNIGVDGTKIWDRNEDSPSPIGTDLLVEHYGELEDISGIHFSDENITYKINYIKSIKNATENNDTNLTKIAPEETGTLVSMMFTQYAEL